MGHPPRSNLDHLRDELGARLAQVLPLESPLGRPDPRESPPERFCINASNMYHVTPLRLACGLVTLPTWGMTTPTLLAHHPW